MIFSKIFNFIENPATTFPCFQSPIYITLSIFICTLAWALVYKIANFIFPEEYLRNLPGASRIKILQQYYTMMCSLLNTLYLAVPCGYWLYVRLGQSDLASSNNNILQKSLDLHNKLGLEENLIGESIMLTCIASYLLHDLVWITATNYSSDSPEIFFHHLVGILSSLHGLYSNLSGFTYVFCLCLSEISSIALSLRWFIKFHGWSSKLENIFNVLFLSLFLFFRTFLGHIALYVLLFSEKREGLFIRVQGVLMTFVNYYFLWQIFVMVVRSFGRAKASQEREVSDE